MRWSVCATVAEPTPLLVAFAAHHLDLGAAQVFLYLDKPAPNLDVVIGDDPRVTLIDAGRRFYLEVLRRSYVAGINRRQIFNAAHAQSLCDADWLFHLDADEFLSGDPVPELLAIPESSLGLHVPNLERAFLQSEPPTRIFDGVLVNPIKRLATLKRVRGPEVASLSRWGFFGHNSGKGACRIGHGIKLGIHRPRIGPEAVATAQILRVAHFDGLSPLHWALKLQRHAENGLLTERGTKASTYRGRQIQMAHAAGSALEAILELHERLRVISPHVARKMKRRGLLMPIEFDPEAAIKREFPGRSADLSIAGFDKALVAHFAQQSAVLASKAV